MHIYKLKSVITIKYEYRLQNDRDYTLSKEVIFKIGAMKSYRPEDCLQNNTNSLNNNNKKIVKIMNELSIELRVK